MTGVQTCALPIFFNAGGTKPFDVINVWDYEKGISRIGIAGFAKEVEGWLDENLPDER